MGNHDPVALLADALRKLDMATDRGEVQFVLSAKD
jgi:hypothetical protein